MIKFILSIFQPSLVNEQLGQLYMDMRLEGAEDRLHIEAGSSASSSSEDESFSENPKPKKVCENLFRSFFRYSLMGKICLYEQYWYKKINVLFCFIMNN